MSTTTDHRPPILDGTPEWFRARLGRVTASRFADVMTQPRSKADRVAGTLSATARSYLSELVAEVVWKNYRHSDFPPNDVPDNIRCLWGPPSTGASLAMKWGTHWQDEARAVYGHYFGVDVTVPGFLTHPDLPLVGASPDGLVGDDEILEIKCPATKRHIETLMSGEMPSDYIAQVQGQLWVTGRKIARFVSYDPRITLLDSRDGKDVLLALAVVDVPRDEAFIAELASAMGGFLCRYCEALDSMGLDAPEPL